MERGDGVIVFMNRAEIDTRAPFRSVKEAVTLFGEKVLAGEIYANKLKEVNNEATDTGEGPSKLGPITAELVETRQSLEKAREQTCQMANCLSSLKEELEKTKRELQQFKEREITRQLMESENEDVKIVEDSAKYEVKNMQMSKQEATEFQKKRYVTFANPPSQARVMIPPQGVETLERHPSLRKKKKKPLIPLIGGIFSRRKGSQQAATTP